MASKVVGGTSFWMRVTSNGSTSCIILASTDFLVDESGKGEFSFEQKSSNGDDDDAEDEDTAKLRDFRGSFAVKRRGEKLEGDGGKRRR